LESIAVDLYIASHAKMWLWFFAVLDSLGNLDNTYVGRLASNIFEQG
jgi:hypothetical protein